MATKFIVPLGEIDKAIRMNCRIEEHSIKPLTLVRDQGITNKAVARSLFIYVSLRTGYQQEEVCDYLGISSDEYHKQNNKSLEYYHYGRELFTKYRSGIPYKESKDTHLFFYRKLLLVSNYLKFRYQLEIEKPGSSKKE